MSKTLNLSVILSTYIDKCLIEFIGPIGFINPYKYFLI